MTGAQRVSPAVAMLVQNEWRHDTRVIREAEAVARQGFRVHVVCRTAGAAGTDRANGVAYHRVPFRQSEGFGDAFAYLRLHCSAVLLGIRHGCASGAPGATRLHLAAIVSTGVALTVAALSALPLAAAVAWSKLPLSARSAPLGDRIRRAGGRLVAPFRHLNEFDRSCRDVVDRVEPDVVHAHDLVTLSAGIQAGGRHRCPVVYDAHELERHTNDVLEESTRRWIDRYEALLAPAASVVVTVCDSIADWLAHEYRIERPVVVLNAPATGPGGSVRGDDVRSVAGLAPETPLCVYVGSVTIDRGLDICVRALEFAPTMHLATVGPRYSETEKEIRAIAESMGVSDRLHLLDPVPPHELVGFITTADCGVMAIQNVCLSYYFCFPNKLLESVYAGLPVVVADLVELRRFVEEHGIGVVVDERDPRSVAGGLIELTTRPERYKPSPATIASIVDRYGWARQEARLATLYERLANRNGRPEEVDSPCAAS